MLIAEELEALTEKLKKNTSAKELAFFHFLINEPIPYSKKKNLSDIEQVCLAAFCLNSPDKNSLVRKLQNTKPIKGMHYTKNLIELAACARADSDKELNNLKAYAKSHSTRDFFILDRLFPGKLANPPSPKSNVDKVAIYLFSDDFPTDWRPIFLNATAESSDLLDVFVLREAYSRLLDKHPATNQASEISFLSLELASVIEFIDRFTQTIWKGGISLLLILIGIASVVFAYLKWDKAEPIFAILGITSFIATTIFILIFGRDPDKFQFINNAEQFIARILLRIMGINRVELESRLQPQDAELKQKRPRKMAARLAGIAVLLIPLVFLWLALRPPLYSLLHQAQEPGFKIPDYNLQLINKSEKDIAIYYRGEFFLWLPQGVSDQAQSIPGKVEFHLLENNTDDKRELTVPANGKIRVLTTFLNSGKFRQIYEGGETDLEIILIRNDSKRFIVNCGPFTQKGMLENYSELVVSE